MREEFGTPDCNKSFSVKVPSVGVLGGRDSGLKILHGGVGGDVELGARTSKHILAFAFDPLSLNSLSHLIVQSIIHIIISYLLVAIHPYMLGLLVCVPHLYLINKSFT